MARDLRAYVRRSAGLVGAALLLFFVLEFLGVGAFHLAFGSDFSWAGFLRLHDQHAIDGRVSVVLVLFQLIVMLSISFLIAFVEKRPLRILDFITTTRAISLAISYIAGDRALPRSLAVTIVESLLEWGFSVAFLRRQLEFINRRLRVPALKGT
eukprot:gnl/Chilomastix_cuspidata/5516.p2 GENE.gnl/Chilomastix_cuspidata/5516~~gnl/Chilomastix_cuspidata/5516.p2  ORF type:complete len:154 (+),score=51.39 gnl/Chilomastix_cuspidata/5516:19-480(+)